MGASPLAAARRGTADLIADELRTRILRGDLQPGDPLREVELARTFDVARNTVREALRLLTRSGLAVHQVHRGVTVRRFAAAEIAEHYAVRELLEVAAAWRAGTLSAGEVAGIEAILDASERAEAAGDWRAVFAHNVEYHRALVALAGNARLDQSFAELLAQLSLVLVAMERDNGGPWLARNRALLEDLRTLDPAGATESIRRYVRDSCAYVLERLPASAA